MSIFTATFCLLFVNFLNLIIFPFHCLIMAIFQFYLTSLVTRYPDVEVNPGRRSGVPARCRIIFANINGLQGNLDKLAVAASHFEIIFCCETKATR